MHAFQWTVQSYRPSEAIVIALLLMSTLASRSEFHAIGWSISLTAQSTAVARKVIQNILLEDEYAN